MKKIIAVFALALLFVQCAEESMPSTETNVSSSITKKPGGNWPLLVRKNSVTDKFVTSYSKIIADNDSIFYYVDLSLESDVTEIVNWLINNDDVIDYLASYQNIEASHKLDLALYPQVLLVPDTDFKAISLPDIRSTIEGSGAVFGNHFQYFLSFSVKDEEATVQAAPYVQNGTCYSMPLINSIVANNQLNPNITVFEFAQATINSQNTLIFRVKNTGGNYMYYDFSNNPPIR
ncbi:hypothetical protein ACLI08_06120 [Flavobacterium sp. RNTU_13]|uniref:hypothetical protein n=1 Tax=Flavobacterium sp. RNTU_13 TaxID=3375145 RepID=UPI0039880329